MKKSEIEGAIKELVASEYGCSTADVDVDQSAVEKLCGAYAIYEDWKADEDTIAATMEIFDSETCIALSVCGIYFSAYNEDKNAFFKYGSKADKFVAMTSDGEHVIFTFYVYDAYAVRGE